MSQEHLDAVRSVYDAWGRGDFQGSPDVYDPLAVLVQGEGFPDKGAHLGIEGIRKYTRGFLEAWERITIEADELIEAGDSVIAAVVQRGVGQGSGAPAEFRYFHVWTFRGDRVIRLETVRERAQALALTGLSS
jgi:ketosteroid isomerase-like protein